MDGGHITNSLGKFMMTHLSKYLHFSDQPTFCPFICFTKKIGTSRSSLNLLPPYHKSTCIQGLWGRGGSSSSTHLPRTVRNSSLLPLLVNRVLTTQPKLSSHCLHTVRRLTSLKAHSVPYPLQTTAAPHLHGQTLEKLFWTHLPHSPPQTHFSNHFTGFFTLCLSKLWPWRLKSNIHLSFGGNFISYQFFALLNTCRP